ncbi:MAG: hypothetical protein ACRC6A_12430 [Fusobacteriaceae bacterium]
MRDKLNKNIYIIAWSILILLNGVFIWNIQKIFPPKYFFDSKFILNLINNNLYHTVGQSYRVTANFFSLLNLNTLQEYNIVIYLIFLVFFIPYLKLYYIRNVYINLLNFIYLFLASIYLIRPGKEFLQFIILGFCFKYTKYSWFFLIIGGLLFRKYLIVQGLLFLAIYFYKNTKNSKKQKMKCFYIVGTIIVSIVFNGMVTTILGSRMAVNQWRENDMHAVTIINDIFKFDGMFFLYVNYFINTLRLLFPIELLLKNIKYLPYVIFQIWFTKKLYLWKYKKNYKLYLLYSFIIVSGFFEPDYGSFLRHTVPYFIFLIDFIYKGVKENAV